MKTKTKAELRQQHGTPRQFSAAVLKATAQGLISAREAAAAIRNYEREYAAATGTYKPTSTPARRFRFARREGYSVWDSLRYAVRQNCKM